VTEFTKHCWDDEIKEFEMDGACITHKRRQKRIDLLKFDWMIVLRNIIKAQVVKVYIGFIWLRIGIGDGL
jgi:hypothetical protein